MIIKRRIGTVLLSIGILIGISSCQGGISGEGESITEVRNVDVFNAIELNTSAEVLLTQGPSQQVRVEGQRNILDVLTTQVRRGRLQIDTDKSLGKHNPIRIYITVPNVEALTINGSGAINGQNMLSVEDLRLEVSGSGEMDVHARASNIQSIIEGSGDIKLRGSSNGLIVNVGGSGNVQAFDLATERAEVVINGSGDCEVNARSTLKAVVNGSGDVRYRGEPADRQFSMQGSGNIVRAD
ncbi:head GIN domain-containing protein [soil metagenome]